MKAFFSLVALSGLFAGALAAPVAATEGLTTPVDGLLDNLPLSIGNPVDTTPATLDRCRVSSG